MKNRSDIFEVLIFHLSKSLKVVFLAFSILLFFVALLVLPTSISYLLYMFVVVPMLLATIFFGTFYGLATVVLLALISALLFASFNGDFSSYLPKFIAETLMTLIVVFVFGKIRQMTFTMYDEYKRITKYEKELKEQKALIEQHDQRLNRIFNNANFGIYRSTPEGKLLMANPSLARIFKYPDTDELIANCQVENDTNPFFKSGYFKELIEYEGRIQNNENQWQAKDASFIYTRETAWVCRDNDGAAKYYEGIIEDITNSFLAEENLKKSERRFRSIFENANAGIYRRSPDGLILMANQQLLNYLVKISPAYLEFFNPEDQYHIGHYKNSKFYKTLLSKDKIVGFEHCFTDNQSNEFYFSDSAWLVKNDKDEIQYIEGIIQDITENKKAEKEIKRYIALLEKEIDEKNKLVKDLNTALNEVTQLSGLLPICSRCKSIRDDSGYWNELEDYFSAHSTAQFSHSLCPKCTLELYPKYADNIADKKFNDNTNNDILFDANDSINNI